MRRRWMRQQRGVRESTLDNYGRVVRELVRVVGAEPAEYTVLGR